MLTKDPGIENRQHRIAEYYRRIDAGDVDWVLKLFAPQAVYRRAESIYSGKPAIAEFFRHERKISGEHRLEDSWALGDVVICTGTFTGHGADGSDRAVRFADFWQFDAQGQVHQRDTYLALGADYVRR